jgi:glucosamine-6-phosphate deaminase
LQLWYEWDYEIDMAAPLSPDEVLAETTSYFIPPISKGSCGCSNNDSREFWVRAEDRNKIKANIRMT